MITRASSTDLPAIASMCSERVFKGFLALMWVGHDYYTGPVSRRSPFEATMMKRPIEWADGGVALISMATIFARAGDRASVD